MTTDEALYQKSASGGIFAAIAKRFIEQGGVVVGAAMCEDLVVRHICIDNTEEVYKLQGSKYVQSDMGDCIRLIATHLRNRKVLFCGTSCQVAGILNVINRHSELEKYLYTVNLVCHGVPSPRFFREHIRQTYGDVKHVKFRHRTWSELSKFAIGYEKNGKYNIISPTNRDIYYSCFSSRVSLRESCYRCGYAKPTRIGDITLGDCGTYNRYEENLADYKTLSMVAIHTEKGKKIFNDTPHIKKVAMDYTAECACNKQLSTPTIRPTTRDTFYKIYFSCNDSKKNTLKPYLAKESFFGKIKTVICMITPHRLRKKVKRLLKKMKLYI